MRAPAALFLALTLPTAAFAAQQRSTLDIYVVDVEGGNGTLFVTPSGESVLIDTGNVGDQPAKRDAGRIMDAVRDAGLTQIDHLILTHYHGDHFGGMEELSSRSRSRNSSITGRIFRQASARISKRTSIPGSTPMRSTRWRNRA